MSDSTELVTTISIIDNASKVLESIEAAANRTAAIFDKLLGIERSLSKISNPLGEVSESMNRIADRADEAEDAVSRLKGALDDVDATSKRLTLGDVFGKIVSNGANIFGLVQMASGALSGFQSAMAAVDANTSMISRLGQVARNEGIAMEDKEAWQGRAEEIRKMLSAQAIDLGLDTTEYTNNAITFASNPAFKSIEEASRFSELMSKQFFTSGVGGQAQMSVINQLTQGLGKGKLQGEDLMSILSNAPDVGKLLEDAYARLNNLSVKSVTGKVRELAGDGKLTADVIKEAFFGAAETIEANFEEMPNTFEDMITKFKGRVLESFQPIMQLLANIGNSDAFKSLLNSLSSIIGTLVGAVEKLSPLLEVAMDVVSFLVESADVVVTAITAPLRWFGDKKTGKELVELNATHFNTIEKGIDNVADKVGDVGKDISGYYKKLDELVQDNLKKNAPKTWEAYADEKLDAMLKNNRLATAEANAQSAAGENWAKMDELERLDAIKQAYDSFGESGINSAADVKAFEESIKQGEEALRRLDEESRQRKYEFEEREARYLYALKHPEEGINVDSAKTRMEETYDLWENAAWKANQLFDDIQSKRSVIQNVLGMLAVRTANIDKNTRRVSINRDDLLFMKNIATAQIINNYNNSTNTANFNQSFGSGSPASVRKAASDGWSKARRGSSSSVAG